MLHGSAIRGGDCLLQPGRHLGRRPGPTIQIALHLLAVALAQEVLRSTHSPIVMFSPVSSARGMKEDGARVEPLFRGVAAHQVIDNQAG
jgi:hypothetical protein